MDSEGQPAKQERSRTRWTAALDQIFADLVVKQIQLGNRPNNVFDKKTWTNIRDEFNNQTHLNFNNNQLRKHLDVLRTRYYNLKSSYDHNDFAIDDSCCIGFDLWEDIANNFIAGQWSQAVIIVGGGGVFDNAHPRPETTVKVKECPIYDQLCAIFTDTSVDGKYAQSSHFESLDKSVQHDTGNLPACLEEEIPHFENQQSTRVVENNALPLEKVTKNVADRKRKRQNGIHSTLGQSRKEEELSEAMAEAMFKMIAAWKSRTTIIPKDDKFTITNCIRALDEIEGIDDIMYFAALDMFEDPNFRETFLSLKGNKLRWTWVQGKCGSGGSRED
ncbi:hypothetical protein ACFE04_012325 [Oxalis oulophora]